MHEPSDDLHLASADLCNAIETFTETLLKLYLLRLELDERLMECEMVGWEC